MIHNAPPMLMHGNRPPAIGEKPFHNGAVYYSGRALKRVKDAWGGNPTFTLGFLVVNAGRIKLDGKGNEVFCR